MSEVILKATVSDFSPAVALCLCAMLHLKVRRGANFDRQILTHEPPRGSTSYPPRPPHPPPPPVSLAFPKWSERHVFSLFSVPSTIWTTFISQAAFVLHRVTTVNRDALCSGSAPAADWRWNQRRSQSALILHFFHVAFSNVKTCNQRTPPHSQIFKRVRLMQHDFPYVPFPWTVICRNDRVTWLPAPVT